MFKRFLHHQRGISKSEAVYLVEVTEHWNNSQHAYWAFTDPTWYKWATISNRDPAPPSLIHANSEQPAAQVWDPPVHPLPENPSKQDRVRYVIGGAFADGEFVGRGHEALEDWLQERTPLGVLSLTEQASRILRDGN